MSRLRPVVLLATAFALLAAACSSGSDTANLDVGKAEQAVRALEVKLYGGDVRVGGARCPKKVEQKKGNTFTCTIAVGGQPLLVRVLQRDDKGNSNIAQAQAVIATAKAESYVLDYARRKGTPVTSVSCARTKILIRSPGQTITCRVQYPDGTTGTARMQVGDTGGKVGIQSLTKA